eukprot:1159148-Pelagomonas_calceolata.AAC.25
MQSVARDAPPTCHYAYVLNAHFRTFSHIPDGPLCTGHAAAQLMASQDSTSTSSKESCDHPFALLSFPLLQRMPSAVSHPLGRIRIPLQYVIRSSSPSGQHWHHTKHAGSPLLAFWAVPKLHNSNWH